MSVAPRWKRRADEIAEAIGDELSINGTVSIGNDVNLSVATITALANAITTVLNPTDIATAMAAITMPVSVVSTSTTPVHVQVRNIAGGFTAMGSDISTSMKLTNQPVSVADTVNVKTATGESVAITGSVNLNVGSSTVPISNPNNITVPVANTNSVTVPVSLGSITIPIKATAAGIPQNASGVSVYVPVDGNHSVTVPVGVGSSTVPVSVGSVTVPVSTSNLPSVPVKTVTGTTNAADGTGAAVVVPVNSSGAVLDVKIVEISATAPVVGGVTGVAPTEAFEAAMEDALNDADEIDVREKNIFEGIVMAPANGAWQVRYFSAVNSNLPLSASVTLKDHDGLTIPITNVNFVGMKCLWININLTGSTQRIYQIHGESDFSLGSIVSFISPNTSTPTFAWTIRLDNGTFKTLQQVYTSDVYTPYNTWITAWNEKYRGARVVQYTSNDSFIFVKQN